MSLIRTVRCLFPNSRQIAQYARYRRPGLHANCPYSTALHPISITSRQNHIATAPQPSPAQGDGEEQRASEIRDAKLVFNEAWRNIESYYGRENIRLPREFFFLMGAPGSGKGTHTPSIMRARGITNRPISVSQLLQKPEYRDLINRGQMVSDRFVIEVILHAMLNCDPSVGVLVDGFPRTNVQVEALKFLHEKMTELRREFYHTDRRDQFPRPVFRICVLYVDEEVSVQRQLDRGRKVRQHNIQVRKTGQGQLLEERVTDSDEMVIRERYNLFREYYDSLLKLSKIFPFRLINASGSIKEVMQIILKEFEYQSSLELDSDTYDAIAHIPLATEIGIHARQDLIGRLENYQDIEPNVLKRAIRYIDQHVIPQVTRHSFSGHVMIRTEDPQLNDSHFVNIIMDVLSERGYHVSFDSHIQYIPTSVNIKTGKINLKKHHVHVMNVNFPKHYIRALEQKFD
ncbi:putative adenylate kinase [Radiomyces spectabilis]|uniref:putative adenylate kinase n=1 Tax=Radiomyces spectabilis TaxID=64574 RepID=UPI00221FB74F|nr:putative adenylate kinase [Radiomyces spectabilis]KAI8381535.1 putative adenylate kinase [Radiomyces spectabilis]